MSEEAPFVVAVSPFVDDVVVCVVEVPVEVLLLGSEVLVRDAFEGE